MNTVGFLNGKIQNSIKTLKKICFRLNHAQTRTPKVSFYVSGIWIQSPSEYRTPEYWIHLNTRQYWCTAFEWLSQVTWWTIRIPDILDILTGFFNLVFRPPFEYRTQMYHLNNRLVPYSDGNCILIFTAQTNKRWGISFRISARTVHLFLKYSWDLHCFVCWQPIDWPIYVVSVFLV